MPTPSLRCSTRIAQAPSQRTRRALAHTSPAPLSPRNAPTPRPRSAGSYEAALTDADRCVSMRPEWAKGHTRRASALHGLRRHMDAIAAYDEALRLEPADEQLLLGRRQASFALAIEV